MHSAKGSTWKKHKYIRIDNGHYIYDNDISDVPQRISSYSGDKETDEKDISRIYQNEYALSRGKMPTPGDNNELEYAYKSKKAALDTGYAFYKDEDRDKIRKKYENLQLAKRKKRATAADKKRLKTK